MHCGSSTDWQQECQQGRVVDDSVVSLSRNHSENARKGRRGGSQRYLPTRSGFLWTCIIIIACFTSRNQHQVAAQQYDAPWRRQNNPSYANNNNNNQNGFIQNNPRYQPPPHAVKKDYNSHFLDSKDITTDSRARFYNVKFRSRPVNKLSWSSRIIFSNLLTFALQAIKPSVTNMGVKLSDRILRGQELYRLITPVFLHGGAGHLFTNMVSLSR
jgi:Rhomboid family